MEHDYYGKSVLVTGAGGFIGSHLVSELLIAGAKVTALVWYSPNNDTGNIRKIVADTKNLIICWGDVRDYVYLDKLISENEMVFHLAALIGIPYSYISPDSYINTNITGTLNVLQAIKNHGLARGIFVSTSEVYGSGLTELMNEKHPLQAQSPYAASKIGADKLVESYVHSFDLPLILARPFNTYGPGQSMRAVIPTIIKQAITSDEIRLGNVETKRDFVFVKDTVAGLMALGLTHTFGEPINLATGETTTIRKIAKIVKDITNSNAEIIIELHRKRPDKSEVTYLCGDPSKANKLGWVAKTPLETGLTKTIAWITNHQDFYPHLEYLV
ncbi:hypothetical protein LCGC14_0303310 [marine sediment metagenome]|uniref:NAD(P)-binding domain-containing protein n=1 Tax=marine sediment metagenome TaxID=412755 RepID=A0A0F9TPR9_9ZZZZ